METSALETARVSRSRLVIAIDDDLGRAGLDLEELEQLKAEQLKCGSIQEARTLLQNLSAHFLSSPAALEPEVVVILDLMFPDRPTPGLEFLSDLRKGDLRVPIGTPVIVHSARGETALKEAAQARGANGYVVKGGRPTELVHKVRNAFTGEVLVGEALCEVVDINVPTRQILVRVRGLDDWMAERWMLWDIAPIECRIPSTAFYLKTYKRFGVGRHEHIVRSSKVDDETERRDLDTLFRGL